MEKILGYNNKILRVEIIPSRIEKFFGEQQRIIEYVNTGTGFCSTKINWVNKDTGQLVFDSNYDNYIKAQKIISDAEN